MSGEVVRDVMLDLETMGTGTDAAIIAIGAVGIDVIRHKVLDEAKFYCVIDLNSAVENGGTISPATVLWWMQQGEAARKEFTSGNCMGIRKALTDFENFMTLWDFEGVWGNGAGFDNVVLRSAYLSTGIKTPWGFRQDRCYRTFDQMYGHLAITNERQGVHHNALDDAIYQATRLVEVLSHIDSRVV